MSKRRGEDIREYERRRYDAKKQKCMDKNRDDQERKVRKVLYGEGGC